MNIKLGIAPINWTNDDDPTLGHTTTFEQCISEMATAGYIGTELGSKFPRDANILTSALTATGLELTSSWFSTYFTDPQQYDATLLRFLDHLSFTKAIGAKFINLCECAHAIQQSDTQIFSDNKPKFNQTQWQALIKGLHTLGRIAQDFGMRTVYHYHAGTGIFTLEEIDYLMQNTCPDLLGLLLDTGHAAIAAIDPLDLITRYPSRIEYVHLKDIRASVLNDIKSSTSSFMQAVRQGIFTVPGDGSLNFSEILRALKNINYTGWLIVEAEQDPAQAPPLDYAKLSYSHLTNALSPM